MDDEELTLTEIGRILDEFQHRLIYLCENSAIVPDGSDEEGRCSSRRFSERNLFEFSVALTLSEFHIPANLSKLILSIIQSFETEVQQTLPEFRSPRSLTGPKAPKLNMVLTDGSHLSFTLGVSRTTMKIVGKVDLNKSVQEVNVSVFETTLTNTSNNTSNFSDNATSLLDSWYHAYFVLNLTKVAKESLII